MRERSLRLLLPVIVAALLLAAGGCREITLPDYALDPTLAGPLLALTPEASPGDVLAGDTVQVAVQVNVPSAKGESAVFSVWASLYSPDGAQAGDGELDDQGGGRWSGPVPVDGASAQATYVVEVTLNGGDFAVPGVFVQRLYRYQPRIAALQYAVAVSLIEITETDVRISPEQMEASQIALGTLQVRAP